MGLVDLAQLGAAVASAVAAGAALRSARTSADQRTVASDALEAQTAPLLTSVRPIWDQQHTMIDVSTIGHYNEADERETALMVVIPIRNVGVAAARIITPTLEVRGPDNALHRVDATSDDPILAAREMTYLRAFEPEDEAPFAMSLICQEFLDFDARIPYLDSAGNERGELVLAIKNAEIPRVASYSFIGRGRPIPPTTGDRLAAALRGLSGRA